ncbi:UNVERIFIED_CONTAM: hypothetical protein Scaly_2531500 [Sesamum calycinum]|uniref:Uncharacterized protein n=1 Tax=Sesamum calycinum TaxID=2727403 RepID=A0AAW2LTJ0_9LAMI
MELRGCISHPEERIPFSIDPPVNVNPRVSTQPLLPHSAVISIWQLTKMCCGRGIHGWSSTIADCPSPIHQCVPTTNRSWPVGLFNKGPTSLSSSLGKRTFRFSIMEFGFENLNGGSSHFNQDIVRCPFLRNINEPTNFSFLTSAAFPIPVRDGKGPIFEDGPNFDMAFRVFHGQNGVVPLTGRSFIRTEKSTSESSPAQFNPLAARAATISLSAFGPGGPFGFDAFSGKRKKENKDSNSSKKESSSKGGKSEHEAMSNECKGPSAPPGMKYRCPPAIVAARSALAKTAFAKNLRPQPLPAKILVIGVLGMAANIPLGIWREHTEKFSPSWFAAVHAAVPFIAMLRKSVLMPKTAMAFTIAASILGQVIGSRAERHRLKTVAARKTEFAETSSFGPNPLAVAGTRDGLCRESIDWNSSSARVPIASSSTDVFC